MPNSDLEGLPAQPPLTQNTPHKEAHFLSHHAQITHTLPQWLTRAPSHKQQALKALRPKPTHWPKGLSISQQNALDHAHINSWKTHQDAEQELENLKDVYAFAEPLLLQALVERFQVDSALNLKNTFINLYLPLTIPLLGLKTGAFKNWRVSMLDAALHNFEAFEAQPDAHSPDSGFITRPSAGGQYQIMDTLTRQVPIPAFITLCRQLDIGKLYKAHLDNELILCEPDKALRIKTAVRQHLRTALVAASHHALAHKQITQNIHDALCNPAQAPGWTNQNPPTLYPHSMTLLGSALTGVMVFSTQTAPASLQGEVIAYLPDDPQQPVKRHASMTAFASDLAIKLRDDSYQQYFCRFIDHKELEPFLTTLRSKLFITQIDPAQVPKGEGRPEDFPLVVRSSLVEHPVLNFTLLNIYQDYSEYLFIQKRRKLLEDAPLLAVSTDTEDQKTRHDRQQRLKKIGEWAVNAIEIVGSFFIPALGELMMLQMAYQILDDTYEGIRDWTQGKTIEAWDHLFNVLSSTVQIATLSIGSKIIADALKPTPSFVKGLKPVTRHTGEKRLWDPDLTPYQHPTDLPSSTPANDLGLMLHEDAQFLSLEDRTYRVEQEPQTLRYRIKHPSRTQAYSPRLRHNGSGAWTVETEQPLNWDDLRLFKRLNRTAASFSDITASRLLAITQTDTAVLRSLHVDALPTPGLLADSIQRFKIDQDLQYFIEHMQSRDPLVQQLADPQTQLQLLISDEMWSASKNLRVVNEHGETVGHYPSESSTVEHIEITDEQVRGGQLLKTVLQELDEKDIKHLLGVSPAMADPLPNPTEQMTLLCNRLARLAHKKRNDLFASRYASMQNSANAEVKLLQTSFAQLPTPAAQELIWSAQGDEILQLLNERIIPERLQKLALEQVYESRVNHAFEGLFLDSTHSADSEWLTLKTIESLPGWSDNLRLEIRDASFDGPLLNSLGGEQAPIRKVLIKSQNLYSARDAQGLELHGPDDLYAALLHALPDAERAQLGFPHTYQGKALKAAVREHPLLQRQLVRARVEPSRTALDINPEARPRLKATAYPLLGADAPGQAPSPLERRVNELYPSLNRQERLRVIRNLPADPAAADQTLTDLGQSLERLRDDLEVWTVDAPATNQRTGELIPPVARMAIVQDRRAFSRELERCWRRQTAFDNHYADPTRDGFELTFTRTILDNMPSIDADFSHVTYLSLRGSGPVTGVNEFLQNFPKLRALKLQGFALDTVPESLSSMQNLTELYLEDSNITLTPTTAQALSGLENLEHIDLDGNPLNLTPDFSNMQHLNSVFLSNTELSEFPTSLLGLPEIETIDLSDNLIIDLPSELFEAPAFITEALDLAGNPLSEASLNRAHTYFSQTGIDMNISFDDLDPVAVDIVEPEQ